MERTPEFKTESERLYFEMMGPEAFERQAAKQTRVCNCGEGAPSRHKWRHRPGCVVFRKSNYRG